MRALVSFAAAALLLAAVLPAAQGQSAPTTARPGSLVIVFRDGHRQTFSLNDIQRLEFPGPVPAGLLSVPAPRARIFWAGGRWAKATARISISPCMKTEAPGAS